MRKEQPLYFKIRKNLEDELHQANFNSDWKKIQDINLKLLWLRTLIEVNPVNFLKESENDIAKNLTEDEIKFPTKFELSSLRHFPFTQQIISEYGKILEKNEYSNCLYKPDKILTHPKESIKKAIEFTFHYMNYDKPLYELPDKKGYAAVLDNVSTLLDMTFVDTQGFAKRSFRK
ncbi:MAG: hypothetical protein M3R36_14720 [Bacteroidota bacterium]|nr:hypothetical protein [Bacteroidota bacterium]